MGFEEKMEEKSTDWFCKGEKIEMLCWWPTR